MPVAITIRNVPDELRDELAARAARAGQSMQEYVRALLVARARSRVEATGTRLDAAQILGERDAERR